MDYENVSVDDEDFEEVSLCSELYEPVVNIILLKTKLFAVLCYNSASIPLEVGIMEASPLCSRD